MLRNDVEHGSDDILHIRIFHLRIDWQRNCAQVLRISIWEISRLIAIALPIIWVQMQRNKMHAGTDIARFQLLHKFGPVNREGVQIKTQHIQMPSMLAVISGGGQL